MRKVTDQALHAFEHRTHGHHPQAGSQVLKFAYLKGGRPLQGAHVRSECVRLHGDPAHDGDYKHTALEAWARRIDDWHSQGLDVFVYLTNYVASCALQNARTMRRLLAVDTPLVVASSTGRSLLIRVTRSQVSWRDHPHRMPRPCSK
jgi:uncharacterized protein YecE (DUF72 family)